MNATLRCKITRTQDTCFNVVRDGATIRVYGGYATGSSNILLLKSTEYPSVTAAKAAMNDE